MTTRLHIAACAAALAPGLLCAAGARRAAAQELTPQVYPHGSYGSSVAQLLSPDGRRMATLGGGTVAMWDTTKGELLWKRAGAAGYGGPYPREVPLPGPLAWSPDGRALAAAQADGSAALLDARAGRESLRLRPAGAQAWKVQFAADGKTVIVTGLASDASSSVAVSLWDARTGAPRAALPTTSRALATPDGSEVFTDDRGAVHGWDGRTGALRSTAAVRDFRLWPDMLSRDGVGIALTQEAIGTVRRPPVRAAVVDMRTAATLRLLEDPARDLDSAAISPDGRFAATASLRKIILWDARTGAVLRTIVDRDLYRIERMAFSPDGADLAADDGGRVAVFRLSTGHRVLLAHTSFTAAFSRDGRKLAGSEWRNPVVWDLATGKAVRAQIADTGRGGGVFSPDGRLLALAPHLLLDLREGRFITPQDDRLRTAPGQGAGGSAVPWPAWFGDGGLRFSSDGSRLAIAYSDGSEGGQSRLLVYDVATGTELPSQQPGNWARLSPDFSTALVEYWNERVQIVDASTGKVRATVQAGSMTAFSDDSRLLALGPARDQHSAPVVYDARTGRLLRQMLLPSGVSEWTWPGSIPALVFSHDGALLTDGRYVWTVRSGACLPLQPSPGFERPAAWAFTPDGRSIARSVRAEVYSAKGFRVGAEVRIGLWDTATGERRPAVVAHDAAGADRLAFSPDGRTLANAGGHRTGGDGTIELRDATTGRLLRRFEDCHEPALSPDWRLLVGDSADGLRFHDPASGRVLPTIAFVPPPAAAATPPAPSWIAFTPDGRYDCTPDARQYVRWQSGGRLLPPGFDPPGRRTPGLVGKALRGQIREE